MGQPLNQKPVASASKTTEDVLQVPTCRTPKTQQGQKRKLPETLSVKDHQLKCLKQENTKLKHEIEKLVEEKIKIQDERELIQEEKEKVLLEKELLKLKIKKLKIEMNSNDQ